MVAKRKTLLWMLQGMCIHCNSLLFVFECRLATKFLAALMELRLGEATGEKLASFIFTSMLPIDTVLPE